MICSRKKVDVTEEEVKKYYFSTQEVIENLHVDRHWLSFHVGNLPDKVKIYDIEKNIAQWYFSPTDYQLLRKKRGRY